MTNFCGGWGCCLCRMGVVCVGHPDGCCEHCPGDTVEAVADVPEDVTAYFRGQYVKLEAMMPKGLASALRPRQ